MCPAKGLAGLTGYPGKSLTWNFLLEIPYLEYNTIYTIFQYIFIDIR